MTFQPAAQTSDRMPTRWQVAYRQYRGLEQKFTDSKPPAQGFLFLLHAAAEGQHVFEKRFAEYNRILAGDNKGNLPAPPDDLIAMLSSLGRLRSSYSSNDKGFVYEDLYHLAFSKLAYWRRYGEPIQPAERCMRLYRGQRVDSWDVGASIYRGLPDEDGRHEALKPRVEAVRRLGQDVAAMLGLSFVDAMAVCQHYSDSEILGVPTWLVDFSRDPWVGLFFASDGGRTGEIGIVWDIMTTEYAGHAAGKGNPIGGLQFAVPPRIPRIENQSGVFIVAGLPQIFSQYVAFGWDTRFRQHTGDVFEDPVMGIGPATIYPPDDQLRFALAELKQAYSNDTPSTNAAAIVPDAVFSSPYHPKTYQALLRAWLDDYRETRLELTPHGVEELLSDLARFHALLHSPRFASRLPNIVSRSLNRLRSAFDAIYFATSRGSQPSARHEIEKAYMEHGSHHPALYEALDETIPRDGA
jgi:FRG domain